MGFENTTFVFVIGAPRSGTTWLHKMIAEHEAVFSLNGSNTFLQGYILPLENRYGDEKCFFSDRGFTRGLASKLNQTEFEQLLFDFIRRFYDIIPQNKKFYVEKATDITSKIHKIRKYIPKSKFIHIIRDGRNATLSEIKFNKKYGPNIGIDDIYRGAVQWKRQIQEVHENSSLFATDVFEVKYEDLFNNTEFYLGKIFDHIGFSCDKKTIKMICNKFNYSKNPVSNPTSSFVNSAGKPVQVYENEMSLSDQALFEYLTGNLLTSLGYSNKKLLNNKVLFIYTKFIKIPGYFIKKDIFSLKMKFKRRLKRMLARLN